MRIHHVALRVRDVESARRFYRDVFELTELRAPREGVAWFDLTGTILMIEPCEGALLATSFDSDEPGIHLLALSIGADERMLWRERLMSKNVRIEKETAFTMYVRDPEGNRVGLSHYPVDAIV